MGICHILAAADRMRTDLRAFLSPDARDRNERNAAMARAVLGDARYDAAWQAGCALSIEQVIVEALSSQR